MSNDLVPTASNPGSPGDGSPPTASRPPCVPVESESTRDPYAPTSGHVNSATEAATPSAPPGYELLDEIGSGGMGVVYRARDIALNRHVALKILHTRYAIDGVAARRFNDEAAITGQLQHPGIPPIHQIGTLPGSRPFLAMKLIKGSTLEDLLKERTGPVEDRGRFLAVFEQVCQAVGYAHAHNVIHRDLKPANVMVGSFAEVQVMDWGLAKTLTADRLVGASATEAEETLGTEILSLRDLDSATQAGSILGTPAYMPPEQAGGEIAKIGSRSDVFGLGAILCVILTGKPPYASKDSDTVRLMAIRGQLSDAQARLDACGAEPELIALCKRCLSLDPADRPADGGEVAAAVAAFREDSEERARQAELERARAEVAAAEQKKRRKVQAILGLTFTALVILGGAFAWWAQQQRLAKEADERERRVAVERDVSHTIEDAAGKFERAQGARRDLALWAEARAAALQAESRAAEANAPQGIRDRIRNLVAEIEQTEKNRRLVAALLEIHAGMGDELTPWGDQDFAGADARYAQAFREYGTDLLALPPDKGAELLRKPGSEVLVDVAAALDDWGYLRYMLTRGKLEDTQRLFQVTRLLDPDPMRNRIRDVVAARDAAGLNRIAEELDPATQPVQTVNLVAVYLYWLQRKGYDLGVGLRAAKRFLQKSQPHHPGDFQINVNLAYMLGGERRPAEAIPYCTAAIAVRPKSAVAWQQYAWALGATGRDAEALAANRRICSLAPKSGDAHYQAARLLTKLGDPEGSAAASREAIRLFREAIPLYPQNAKLRFLLSRALDSSGNREAALATITEALRFNLQNPGAHELAARLYLLDGKPRAALPFAQKAVELDRTGAQTWSYLGSARQGVGDLDGAIAAFREGLKRDAKHPGCQTGLAAALKAKRDRTAPPPREVKQP